MVSSFEESNGAAYLNCFFSPASLLDAKHRGRAKENRAKPHQLVARTDVDTGEREMKTKAVIRTNNSGSTLLVRTTNHYGVTTVTETQISDAEASRLLRTGFVS